MPGATTSAARNFQEKVLAENGVPLGAEGIEVLQVNLGFRCNMSCKHCHVEAGPSRKEMMSGETADGVISVFANSDIPTLDITGGAPELNPHFKDLVREARGLSRRVIVRSNLTVVYEEGMEGLFDFYAEQGVEVTASLPYYLGTGVDRVRGVGTFEKSIGALRRLNELGFGIEGGKTLNLVYNPTGAFLPPRQETLEEEYRRELRKSFGISFDRIFTFTNMPIGRFKEFLELTGNYRGYMERLVTSFNPSTLGGLMCRHLLSVSWDGTLYDCDFNLALGLALDEDCPGHISDFDFSKLSGRKITVAEHCFGCTAGHGST